MNVAALLAALSLAAQDPGTNVAVYDPAFFAESRPANAFDMVRRLPGFTLVESDEDVRGFAGATGNVLFDGRAPASKQESLEALLRRIPAGAVERIELIRGGAAGIDTGGFDVVANVVRRRTGSSRGAAEAGGSIGFDGIARPSLRLEAGREAGNRRLEGTFSFASELDEDSGDGRLDEYDADGARTDGGARREVEVEDTLAASGEYETPLAGGTASLNASVERERTREEVRSRFDDGIVEIARERETIWSGEAAARLRRGTLEALLLQRLGRLRLEEDEEDESFQEATRTRETIARLDYRQEHGALSLHGAIEGALNGLNSNAQLVEDGAEVPLPGADANVREERAEAAIGATWRASAGVVLETSLAAEISRLTSETQRLSFLFWKPRVALTAPLGPGQLRASLGKEVGQLDFRDFVASASLDRGDVSAGAVSLRPPQTWATTIGWEMRFWGEGALSLSWRHEWIDDVVDRVAVMADGEIFDAVGNIGRGQRDIGQAELSLPLGRFGLTGVQLRGSLTLRRSRVTDPVTGERRSISEDLPIEGEVRLIHDIPGGRWSWGLDLALAEREQQFRFDEVREERQAAGLSFHAEYRPSPVWRLRLEARNLTSRASRETREEYDGLRSIVPLDEIERRRIETAPLVVFSVRRSFGGGSGQAGSAP